MTFPVSGVVLTLLCDVRYLVTDCVDSADSVRRFFVVGAKTRHLISRKTIMVKRARFDANQVDKLQQYAVAGVDPNDVVKASPFKGLNPDAVKRKFKAIKNNLANTEARAATTPMVTKKAQQDAQKSG